MNKDEEDMARGFYGYGHWDAPYWFIGPEQGMGRHEGDVSRRVRAWQDLGKRDLNDCREFHRHIDELRFHFKEPVALQSTWRRLMLLLMTFQGGKLTGDKLKDQEILRAYQRDRWGVRDKELGETCVIELSGLAAPSLKESKETGQHLQERIRYIRNKMRDNRSTLRLIVMYGKGQKNSWDQIAGKVFPAGPESFLIDGLMILAFTSHPNAHRLTDQCWEKVGETLRKESNRL